MATLLNTMHGAAEPTTWAPEGAALPAIKGATSVRSPSRRPSTASVRSDGNGSQAPEMLMKQAEQWRQLYHDSEATCAQVKGERTAMHDQLSEALDRERQWAAESLELRCKTEELEEVQNALNEQLTNGRLLLQNKEESLCMLRCQLEAKEEELEKGRREQRQSQDLCRRLEDTLAQMAEQERQAAEQHEAELSKLNSELQQQKDLTSQAVQEVRDLTAESEQLQQKLQEAEVARQRMEEEIAHLRQPLEDIEKQWAEKLANSEQQLKAKKEAVATLQDELLEKDEEVERLRRTSRRASLSEQQSEVEKEELAKKLDTAAKRAASKEHDCDMKDSELWRLKTELKTERELCQSALQEAATVRHCYTHKIGDLTAREQAAQRMMDRMDAERSMWVTRNEQLELANARLREELQSSLSSGAQLGVALLRDASVKAMGEVAKLGLSPRSRRPSMA